MPKKPKVSFVCSVCGAQHASWMGRCNACGEWNTLTQQLEAAGAQVLSGRPLTAQPLSQLVTAAAPQRLRSLESLDTVLGGGIVAGSVILLAGQPGIGKSTLLLQTAHAAAKTHKVLYVSGEESAHQVGLRARRLGANHENLHIVASVSADDIAATISRGVYDLVVVDSIQTVSVAAITSAAGSVSQIQNAAQSLIHAAKHHTTALLLVGHVTKEGSIAGPKLLEHVVDVVLQLDGDRYGGFKMLRSTKNRFGGTGESAIYEMAETGLSEVANPSQALLAERQVSDGSVVLATIEGARPLLVEIQALVNPTSYGYPKRAASGFDLNRLNLLVAMLEKRTKLKLQDKDIYLNIVGGLKINEPAADLAVCMAIASAAKGMMLKHDAVVFGEVGLSGEVRRVPFADKRLAEARKLGFTMAIAPKSSAAGTLLHPVSDIRAALNQFLEK